MTANNTNNHEYAKHLYIDSQTYMSACGYYAPHPEQVRAPKERVTCKHCRTMYPDDAAAIDRLARRDEIVGRTNY